MGVVNILVPYTQRHPKTEAGVPEDATWAYVGDDDHAYWRLLCEWWERGESFLVVEHDVICRPDIIESVETCPEPWCCYGYDDICCPGCMDAWANTLGCTRFRAELIVAVPDAVSSIKRPEHLIWTNVCDGIGTNLRAVGFTHHWHFPAVYHHHMDRAGSRAFGPENRVTATTGA